MNRKQKPRRRKAPRKPNPYWKENALTLEELQTEFTRLQAEQQQALEQERIWHENAVKLQGKLEYVQERAQQLQIEQAQADAEQAETKAAEAATGAYPVRGDEPTVPQDAVSDVVENGHLDAEFGDPDQHPSEEVIYRQTA